MTAESGPDADGSVVVSNFVAADEIYATGKPVRELISARFAGSETSTTCGDVGEKFAQLLFLEMVQEKVGDNDIDFWRVSKPFENIGLDDFAGDGLAIDEEKFCVGSLSCDLFGNISVAGSDFSDGAVGKGGIFSEVAEDDARVAHEGIDAAEIAAGLKGARIGGGKFVEQFWFDDAVHPSRKAP